MKRLIFTLLYKENHFFLSRNFRLKKIGDINWLLENYNFTEVCENVDELIIINLDKKLNKNYFNNVKMIIDKCFLPVTLGGNIKNEKDAEECFANGADKVLISSLFYSKPEICKNISKIYGIQAIVGCIDFIKIEDKYYAFNPSENKKYNLKIKDIVKKFISNGCGELMLQSVDNDGTGQGLELGIFKIFKNNRIPNIIMGGIGKESHIYEGLKNTNVDAISTANLLNFIGDSFLKIRKNLKLRKIQLINWDIKEYQEIR